MQARLLYLRHLTAALAVTLCTAHVALAQGIIIQVTTTGDQDNASFDCDVDPVTPGPQCTLRAAIQLANSTPATDSIRFAIPTSDPGYDPGTGMHTIMLTEKLPWLTTSMSIRGPGAEALTVRPFLSLSFGVFVIEAGNATLSGMTISDGIGTESGGGVFVSTNGTVNVTDCVVRRNAGRGAVAMFGSGTLNVTGGVLTENSGGLVHASPGGTLNVTGVRIAGNTAGGEPGALRGGGILIGPIGGPMNVTDSAIVGNIANEGGGIYTGSTSTLTIVGSTISGNVASFADSDQGGGIMNHRGVVHLRNSTVAGNRARFGGGVVNNELGTTFITNSTITDNEAVSNGGGLFNAGDGPVVVGGTIVAGNVAGGTGPDVFGNFASTGFNVVGIESNNGFSQPTDQKGGLLAPLNPLLDPAGLQANGGGTLTVAPLCGSPAIDGGTASGFTTDQRGMGFPRTVDQSSVADADGGDATDVGAVEVQQECAAAAATPTPTPPPGPTPRPSPPTLDHFVTYRVRPVKGDAKFPPRGPVILADAFNTTAYDVFAARAMALPTNVNGGGRFDSTTRLLEHPLKPSKGQAKPARRVDVHVMNQCSDAHLAVGKPVSLLVPTAPSLTPPVEAIHQLDHLVCYQARAQTKLTTGTALARQPKGAQVDGADQFQTRRYDVQAITKLCVPAAKSGSPVALKGDAKGTAIDLTPSAVRHTEALLVCYRAAVARATIPQLGCGPLAPKLKGAPISPRQPKHAPQLGVLVANQLAVGPRVDSVKELEICVPSVLAP